MAAVAGSGSFFQNPYIEDLQRTAPDWKAGFDPHFLVPEELTAGRRTPDKPRAAAGKREATKGVRSGPRQPAIKS